MRGNSSASRKRDKLGLLCQDRDVMNLLLQLKSRAEICKTLNRPVGTINTSCTRIYETLGCKSLAELVLKYAAFK